MAVLAQSPVAWTQLYNPRQKLSWTMGSPWSDELHFKTTWYDSASFMLFCAGTIVKGSNVTRVGPLQHPDFSGLYCTAITREGKGAARDGVNNYAHADIGVTFSTLPYNVDPGSQNPYMIERTKVGGSFITDPTQNYVANSVTLPQGIGKYVPEITYSLTFINSPTLNDDYWSPYVGKINSATFLNRDIGTVRFDGADTEYQYTGGFSPAFTKQFVMSWRPYSWNKVFLSGSWYDVTPAVYETADFNNLLTNN